MNRKQIWEGPINQIPAISYGTLQRAAELWAQGVPVREISAAIGKTPKQVYHLTERPKNRCMFPRRNRPDCTAEDQRAIIRLYMLGMSGSGIARLFHMSQSNVYRWLEIAKVERRDRHFIGYRRQIPPSEIVKGYLAGMRAAQIAEASSRSCKAVWHYMEAYGLSMEAIQQARGLPPHMLAEYLTALDELRIHEDALEVALEYATISDQDS